MPNNSTSEHQCISPTRGGELMEFIFITLYIAVIVVSLAGNIVILILGYAKFINSTFTNILICNCAISDILITIFPALLGVVDTLVTKGRWYLGSFMCSFVHFSLLSSVAASIFTLMFITIDRYYAVASPYKKVLTTKMLTTIIPVIWFLSFAFASPAVFTQSVIHVDGYGDVCVEQWVPPFKWRDSPRHYTIVLFICFYAIPLITMIVIYSVIAKKLKSKASLRADCRHSPETSQVPATASTATTGGSSSAVAGSLNVFIVKKVKFKKFHKVRAIHMLVAVIIVFAVCWFPVFLLQFLTFFHPYYVRCMWSIPEWAYALSFFMQYANSAINPLLYFGFSSTFRKGLKTFCQHYLKSKRSIERARRQHAAVDEISVKRHDDRCCEHNV